MSDRDAFREAQQERRAHGMKARHETREARAVRKAVAEEIALAIEKRWMTVNGCTCEDCEVINAVTTLAREIGSRDPE